MFISIKHFIFIGRPKKKEEKKKRRKEEKEEEEEGLFYPHYRRADKSAIIKHYLKVYNGLQLITFKL